MWRYIQINDNEVFPTYNLLVGIGIAVAMMYLQNNKSFASLEEQIKHRLHFIILIAIFAGFIGAFILDAYTQNIEVKWHNLNEIGLTFYGGFITGMIVLSVMVKLNALPLLKFLNILTPAFCLAHSIGRIGCFLAGCCFGAPTQLPIGVEFPENSLAHLHFQETLTVHPTQLYESLFVFMIFLIVNRPSMQYKFLFYTVSYAVFRFFVEFIRADNRGSLLEQMVLTPSQLIAMFIFIIGVGVIIYKNFGIKRRTKTIT